MPDCTTRDLVLAEFQERGGETDLSLAGLVESVGRSNGRISSQMELVAAIEQLRESELVELASPSNQDELQVSLTDSGRSVAPDVHDEVAGTPIELVSDDRTETTVGAAASMVGATVTEVARSLVNGVYFHQERMPPTLVGREAERNELRSRIEKARRTATGHALLLTGSGGIGKTAVAEHVLGDLQADGVEVVRTRGRGVDGELYGPVHELLRALDTGSPFEGDLVDPDDPETLRMQRSGLFAAVTDALHPDDGSIRVLFVDDLHLADSGTVAYLSHLLDQLPDIPIVLVGAYRGAELPDDSPFDSTDDRKEVTRIALSPLDPDETRTIIEQAVERPGVPEEFVDLVHDRTGGNALFVKETVNALIDTGKLHPDFEWYPGSRAEFDVPETVSGTVLTQVAALDDRDRELLQWAARIGDAVPVPVLERVVSKDDVEPRTVLEVLTGTDLVEWVDDRQSVALRSEVIRDALLDDGRGSPQEHESIADAFVAEYASEDPDRPGAKRDTAERSRAATIASHYERAGDTGKAITWYRRAGARATDVYAHETAIDYYEKALQLARDADDESGLLDVVERLAEIYRVVGDLDEADKHVRFARERTTDPEREQRLLRLASRIAEMQSDHETAIELADEGLSLDAIDPLERCRLLLRRSKAESDRGEFDRAMDTARDAFDSAVDADDATLMLEAHRRIGDVAVRTGDYGAASEQYQEALTIAEQCEDRHAIATTNYTLSVVHEQRGDLQEALRLYRRSLETFEDTGDIHRIAKSHSSLGRILRKTGEFEEAERHLTRAVDLFTQLGDLHREARSRMMLGTLAAAWDDRTSDVVRTRYEQALSTFEEVGARKDAALARNGLGEIALREGDVETAGEYFEVALEGFEAVGGQHEIGIAHRNLGTVAIEYGEYDSAREHLQQAERMLEEIGDRHRLTVTYVELARAETASGNPDRALERWSDIAAGLAAIPESERAPPFERLIETCRDEGHDDAAREWLGRLRSHVEAAEDDSFEEFREWLESADASNDST